MAMGKRLIDLWTTYGVKKKEIWKKKGEPFFLLSFLQHPPAMPNNRLFKPIVHILIAKSLFDNGHCVTIFFAVEHFESDIIEANRFLEFVME